MEQNEDLGWLIRDSSNVVRGPFGRPEILQLIKKGQLKGKTEIARANSYWFALDEKPELARFFPELGGMPPPDETRMTATLTQADVSGEDRGVEITQFTAMPSRSDLAKSEKAGEAPKAAGEAKIEWLSEEFADEFEGSPLEMESTKTGNKAPQVQAPLSSSVDHEAPTQKVDKNSPMERATVKADTLPSELKSVKGERPKPINALMKGPDTKSQMSVSHNIVNVPVKEHEGSHNIISAEDEAAANEGQRSARRGIAFAIVGVVLLAVLGVAGYKFATAPKSAKKIDIKNPIGDPELALKRSLLLFDLEGAKEAVAELELERKAQPLVPMAQAIMKKEFLFDADGAFVALQTARSLAKEPMLISEIDNLLGIYGYERDAAGSISTLKRIADENSGEKIFRLNQGLALIRSGKYAEATAVLSALSASVKGDEELLHDVFLLLGWSRDLGSSGSDANIEASYMKALDINPASALSRLGLAIFHLRKFGLKEAEADFKQFIELAPELESPSRVVNFRKMSNFDLYNLARREIRDLNVPGGVVGAKPSPLVMAVDAVLSSIQSRTNEASKILDVALSHAPGDSNILKAVAYVRWKDGRYDDVIDLLRDLTKEKNSFALNLLIGKSYVKTGKKSLAEKHFMTLASLSLTKGEGWSSLGELQYVQGNKTDAKRSFQSALAKDPRDLIALKGLSKMGEDRILDSDELESNLPF